MPRKQIHTADLLKDLSVGLREKSGSVGLDRYVPLPKQKQFHKSRKKGRIYSGGNRAGKTVAGAVESAMWLCGKHPVYSPKFPPPVRGRAVGVDFDHGVDQIMLPEIRKWIPSDMLIEGSWQKSYHKPTRILTLKNGSTLEFMSYDQDKEKFVGTSRHFTWFDEEAPENIFNECLARLIDTNGHWWMTVTPLQDFSWLADLYELVESGSVAWVEILEVHTDENSHIDPEALDFNLFNVSDEERQARTKGTGYAGSNLIYPKFSDALVNPPVGQTKAAFMKNWWHFVAMDHGFRNPTAFLFFAVGPDDQILVYDEIYETENLVRDNAKIYMEKVKQLGINPSYVIADPSTRNTDPITGTSVMTEYNEHGVWFHLGNNDVHAGILRVRGMLDSGRLRISKNCVNLIRESRKYKWAKPISSKVQARTNNMETPVKKDDHAMDALRYGVMSLPKTPQEEAESRRSRLQHVMDVADTASVFEKAMVDRNDQVFDEHLGLLD
jgi:phage terminase large subunit-like protein